jgi:hypothetical protein
MNHRRQYCTKSLARYTNGCIGKQATRNEQFFLLRLTVKGAAGTGKSSIINNIVSYLQLMFDGNDVDRGVDPTGMNDSIQCSWINTTYICRIGLEEHEKVNDEKDSGTATEKNTKHNSNNDG